MKDYKSLIADIRTEACELADKQKRLEVFMMSEDFWDALMVLRKYMFSSHRKNLLHHSRISDSL